MYYLCLYIYDKLKKSMKNSLKILNTVTFRIKDFVSLYGCVTFHCTYIETKSKSISCHKLDPKLYCIFTFCIHVLIFTLIQTPLFVHLFFHVIVHFNKIVVSFLDNMYSRMPSAAMILMYENKVSK